MRCGQRQGHVKAQAQTGGPSGDAEQRDGGGVKDKQPGPGVRAQFQGRGFNPDQRVVFLVLMSVDRVVAQRPGDSRRVKP